MELLGLIEVPGWIVGTAIFLSTVYLYTWYKQSFFKRLGIRTKDTTFLFGDLGEIGKKGYGYIDNDMVQQYGKVFGCFMGNVPSLVISDVEIIKQITVKEFSKFADRYDVFPWDDRWKSAINIAKGDHWRFLRSTLSPTFTTGRMKAMWPYIHKCTDTLHTLLSDKIKESPEGFDIVPFLRGYTMDMVCSTGFGLEVSAQTDPDNAFIKHARDFVELKSFNNPLFFLQILFPDLRLIFPWLPKGKFADGKSLDFFLNATEKAFQERKEEQSPHRDFLQLMINAHKENDGLASIDSDEQLSVDERKQRGLTDEEVLINSIVFILAGFDTTATVLSWLIYDFVTQPEIQDKLIEEVDRELGRDQPTYEKVFNLKYMDMVVNESLRVHPILPRLNRMALEDVEIKGLKIKKGTDCTIAPLALHFMPEHWDEPNKYIPERFSPENRSNINEYAYIPFGHGPRNCIGKRLALFELKSTIATLLQNYRFYKTDQLAVPMPTAKRGSNRKPDKPVVVRLEKRQ